MPEADCPWCGKRNTDLWELWPPKSSVLDGFEVEYECGWCDRPVTVRCMVSVDYSMEKREEATQ